MNAGRILTITALAWGVAACSTAPARDPIQYVPQVCTEFEPERPVMPTEQLALPTDPDTFTQSAIAEIERREGYEDQLRTALRNCKRK